MLGDYFEYFLVILVGIPKHFALVQDFGFHRLNDPLVFRIIIRVLYFVRITFYVKEVPILNFFIIWPGTKAILFSPFP